MIVPIYEFKFMTPILWTYPLQIHQVLKPRFLNYNVKLCQSYDMQGGMGKGWSYETPAPFPYSAEPTLFLTSIQRM